MKQSPIDLLPLPEPSTSEFPPGWFYENVAKPLIGDTIRIMHNGLPIDLERVYELENRLDVLLEDVQKTVDANNYIKEYKKDKYPKQKDALANELTEKMRPQDFYLKEFKAGDMIHRSFFMQVFLETNAEDFYDVITPLEEVLPGVPKWSVRDLKVYVPRNDLLLELSRKTVSVDHPIAVEAMVRLANAKMGIYNKSYKDKIEAISFTSIMGSFNPASSLQKKEFFEFLGIEPLEHSKDTGEASWGRDQIEELQRNEKDEDLLELYQAFVDYSFAAIIRNNFIAAFYKYTVNGRLYGQYKLLGAKSGRYTSNSPNMLNAPSTGSIYAKPIKRCFIAPKGTVVYAIDYSALEDRVIASLTKDENKCNIFLEDLDGHCLNAYGYFKDEIAEHMELTGDTTTDVKEFYRLVEAGHKELKAIRQKGKPATFGLSYGAFPAKVSKALKVDLETATLIFNNYHHKLYPGITDYRENYVLTTAERDRRIHLGMGFYIKTDNPSNDIRTLNNATCQFWSILTALAINKIHSLIDEKGWHDKIQVTSTIYDSIYFIVEDDPEVIKWLNDNITEIMATDFMENQIVKNAAIGEIGVDWADLQQISPTASIEEIKQVLKELQ